MKIFFNTAICIIVLISGSVFAYAGGAINSGKPVPVIGNNAISIEFIENRLDKDYDASDAEIEKFARKLVVVLAQLSPVEQNEVWYGAAGGGGGDGDD